MLYMFIIQKISQVGTVLNAQDAKNVIAAGARFFMSPAIIKVMYTYKYAQNRFPPLLFAIYLLYVNLLSMLQGILDELQDKKFLYIPGVMTPTEVRASYPRQSSFPFLFFFLFVFRVML